MRLRFFAAIALSAMVATSAASANNVTRQVAFDDDFSYVKLSISGGNAGGYEGWLKPILVGGKIELCGVGVITNSQARAAIRKSLRGTTFEINGKTYIKDITYFAKARTARRLKSTAANCAATGLAPPKKIDSVDLNWGSATFRN